MSFFSEDRMAEMRQLFFESAREILQTLNEDALKLEQDPNDLETARSVRRGVHTLKGDAAACGFKEMSELAHELEDALAPEVCAAAPAQLAELVLQAADFFDGMLSAYQRNLQPPSAESLRRMVAALRAPASPAIPAGTPPVDAHSAFTEYERQTIRAALAAGRRVVRVEVALDSQCPMRTAARQVIENVLRGLGELLAICPAATAAESANSIEAALACDHAVESIAAKCRVPSLVSAVKVDPWPADPAGEPVEPAVPDDEATVPLPVAEVKPEGSPARSSSTGARTLENTLRVDAERIDQVLNLIGELIIGRSMLQQAMLEFGRNFPKDPLRNRFADVMAFQNRALNDLQRAAMQVRMVPVEQLFRRFPRLVRDIAKETGKDVALALAGQDTELDKSILDAIAEPLAHLVRNAVDHGIESAADRRKAGKPERGTIGLKAFHQGNQVVVEITDDGRGIDSAKVVAKAVERGLLSAEEAANLGESEIAALIFRPGFSTADKITAISGRGVGMDIVQAVMHRLKGSVSVASKPGSGTTITLKVPLTLAIIKALMFRVERRMYALPLNAVAEISRAREADVHRVGGHEVLQLRDDVLTLMRLGRREAEPDPARRFFVAVISVGERKFGLMVDELVGEEELVIKPLDDNVVTTDLVSGASILGDGAVVMVLNLAAVVERYARRRTHDTGAVAGLLSPSGHQAAAAGGAL